MDLKEKLTGLLYFDLFLDEDKYNIDVNEGNIEIKIKVVVPTEITDKFKEHAKGLIKDIKELNIIINPLESEINPNDIKENTDEKFNGKSCGKFRQANEGRFQENKQRRS